MGDSQILCWVCQHLPKGEVSGWSYQQIERENVFFLDTGMCVADVTTGSGTFTILSCT